MPVNEKKILKETFRIMITSLLKKNSIQKCILFLVDFNRNDNSDITTKYKVQLLLQNLTFLLNIS